MGKTLSDRELEQALADIGERLPQATRDLWPAVRERIDKRRARRWWALGVPRGMLAPIAATLAILLVLTLALTPDLVARAAEILGLRGVQIFRVTATPSPAPTTGAVVTFTGQRAASVEEASRIAGFGVREPTALGAPDEIYVDAAPVRVTLVYRSRPGLPATALPGISALVVEFRGRLDQAVVGKTAGPEAHLESVPLNGGGSSRPSAPPPPVLYLGPHGNFHPATPPPPR